MPEQHTVTLPPLPSDSKVTGSNDFKCEFVFRCIQFTNGYKEMNILSIHNSDSLNITYIGDHISYQTMTHRTSKHHGFSDINYMWMIQISTSQLANLTQLMLHECSNITCRHKRSMCGLGKNELGPSSIVRLYLRINHNIINQQASSTKT